MSKLGVLDFLRRNKPDASYLAELGVAGGIIGAQSRSTSEIETQQQLGINVHMIEDDHLLQQLERLAIRPYTVVLRDEKNQPLKDAKGIIQTEQRIWYHPVFMTALVSISKLFSTRWLDKIDALIATYQVRYQFNNLKMKLTYAEYEQWGAFLDEIKRLAVSAICDSVNGRKAKLMKVTPKTFEVQFRGPPKKGQAQGGFMPK